MKLLLNEDNGQLPFGHFFAIFVQFNKIFYFTLWNRLSLFLEERVDYLFEGDGEENLQLVNEILSILFPQSDSIEGSNLLPPISSVQPNTLGAMNPPADDFSIDDDTLNPVSGYEATRDTPHFEEVPISPEMPSTSSVSIPGRKEEKKQVVSKRKLLDEALAIHNFAEAKNLIRDIYKKNPQECVVRVLSVLEREADRFPSINTAKEIVKLWDKFKNIKSPDLQNLFQLPLNCFFLHSL